MNFLLVLFGPYTFIAQCGSSQREKGKLRRWLIWLLEFRYWVMKNGQNFNSKITASVIITCLVAASGNLIFGYAIGISGAFLLAFVFIFYFLFSSVRTLLSLPLLVSIHLYKFEFEPWNCAWLKENECKETLRIIRVIYFSLINLPKNLRMTNKKMSMN